MIQIFKNVNIDWLSYRRILIAISIFLMLAGLGSAVVREWVVGGTSAFNLGVDFKGGTVVTAQFKQRPSAEEVRSTLVASGLRDAIIQPVTDRPDLMLIKLPLEGGEAGADSEVEIGRKRVREALTKFGAEGDGFEIVGTDAVGAVAGAQLRNKAVAVTLAALVGMLVYIAFRFEWTYGAAAVLATFHDVLITLGFFSIFQWEVNLTVIAALLTLVGFSVNDTIVIFDRVRENRRLRRRDSLYKATNDAINQTLSRTVITSGLVFLSVLSLVLFGGEVLRGFSLALLVGILVGTFSSMSVAGPVMVWWEQRLERASKEAESAATSRTVRTRSAAKGRQEISAIHGK